MRGFSERLRVVLVGFGLATLATSAASAAATDVDLELVLAVDISRSMDLEEQRIQRDGYVEAFRSPDVIQAIRDGVTGRIAVTYIEWSNSNIQYVVVPWTIIDGQESAAALAETLSRAPIERYAFTSISGALLFSAGLFDSSGAKGLRRAIDMSGDGPNNMGVPVNQARDEVVGRGITINGLPIMLKRGGFGEDYQYEDLDKYYRDCVIGGPDAFLFSVNKIEQLPVAIRRKLVQEIAALPPNGQPSTTPVLAAASGMDCLMGEKRRGFSQP